MAEQTCDNVMTQQVTGRPIKRYVCRLPYDHAGSCGWEQRAAAVGPICGAVAPSPAVCGRVAGHAGAHIVSDTWP